MKVTVQDDIPASERGKEEKLTIDEKVPSAAFALVGLSYLSVLLIILAGIGACYLVLQIFPIN